MSEVEDLRKRIRELELGAEEPVVRGHMKITEIIVEKLIDGKRIFFCRTPEEEMIFSGNNPGVKTETFHIEMLVSTANKYLNGPENRKQFTRPVMEGQVDDVPIGALGGTESEPNWRQQAKQFGIPLNKETGGSRKKEDVLTDIVAKLTTVSTS